MAHSKHRLPHSPHDPGNMPTPCWANAGPPSATVARHYPSIGRVMGWHLCSSNVYRISSIFLFCSSSSSCSTTSSSSSSSTYISSSRWPTTPTSENTLTSTLYMPRTRRFRNQINNIMDAQDFPEKSYSKCLAVWWGLKMKMVESCKLRLVFLDWYFVWLPGCLTD